MGQEKVEVINLWWAGGSICLSGLRLCPPGPIGSAASGQVVIAVVASRVVEEISSGAEAVTVDHPSWSLRGEQRCHRSV